MGLPLFPGIENARAQHWTLHLSNVQIAEWKRGEEKNGMGGLTDQLPLVITAYTVYKFAFDDVVRATRTEHLLNGRNEKGEVIFPNREIGAIPASRVELS